MIFPITAIINYEGVSTVTRTARREIGLTLTVSTFRIRK